MRERMRRLGIVRDGKLERIGGEYASIVDKIVKYGIEYPDYLTDEEMELINGKVAYFDALARDLIIRQRRIA